MLSAHLTTIGASHAHVRQHRMMIRRASLKSMRLLSMQML